MNNGIFNNATAPELDSMIDEIQKRTDPNFYKADLPKGTMKDIKHLFIKMHKQLVAYSAMFAYVSGRYMYQMFADKKFPIFNEDDPLKQLENAYEHTTCKGTVDICLLKMKSSIDVMRTLMNEYKIDEDWNDLVPTWHADIVSAEAKIKEFERNEKYFQEALEEK